MFICMCVYTPEAINNYSCNLSLNNQLNKLYCFLVSIYSTCHQGVVLIVKHTLNSCQRRLRLCITDKTERFSLKSEYRAGGEAFQTRLAYSVVIVISTLYSC